MSAHSLPAELVDGIKSPELLQGRRQQQQPEGRTSASEEPDHKAKRKAIMLNYHQDTVSLDSVSVSSTSEFSAAGTDDRSTCSPVCDGESSSSGPVDILRGDRVCLNSGERGLGFSDPLSDPLSYSCLGEVSLEVSESSFQTVDSGINVDGGLSVETGKGSPRHIPDGKGSTLVTNRDAGKGSCDSQTTVRQVVECEKVTSEVCGTDQEPTSSGMDNGDIPSGGREVLGAFEDSLSTLPLLLEEGTVVGGSLASSKTSTLNNSTSVPSSGCGTLEAKTLCVGEDSSSGGGVGLSEQVAARLSNGDAKLAISDRVAITNAEPTADQTCGEARPLTSSSDLSPPKDPATHPPFGHDEHVASNGSRLNSDLAPPGESSRHHAYANLQIFGKSDWSSSGGGMALSELVQRGSNRKRCKSNSPYMRKKPKPLPRKSVQEKVSSGGSGSGVGSSGSGVGSVDNGGDARNNIFVSSLPANFKPVPSPRLSAGKPCSSFSPNRLRLPVASQRDSSPNTILVGVGSSSNSPQRNGVSSSTATPVVRSPNSATPRQESSAPMTPSHVPAVGASPTRQGGVSAPGTPRRKCSTPTSPLYTTSSTSTLSSDPDSSSTTTQPQEGATSNPVPPPRRKRRSKCNSQGSSKGSVSTVDVLPTSPEEPLTSQDRLPGSFEQGEGACGGGDARPSSPGSVNKQQSDTHLEQSSLTSDSASSKSRDWSHDLTSEDDVLSSPLLDETNDVFAPDATPTLLPPTSYAGERQSHYSVGSSRTSLTVFPDSSRSSVVSGATLRPTSFISPGDSSSNHFNFSMSYDPGEVPTGGGHTMPRSVMGQTWTPRIQARQSVKTVVPASSECHQYLYSELPLI